MPASTASNPVALINGMAASFAFALPPAIGIAMRLRAHLGQVMEQRRVPRLDNQPANLFTHQTLSGLSLSTPVIVASREG